jgi:hypothetical protein
LRRDPTIPLAFLLQVANLRIPGSDWSVRASLLENSESSRFKVEWDRLIIDSPVLKTSELITTARRPAGPAPFPRFNWSMLTPAMAV